MNQRQSRGAYRRFPALRLLVYEHVSPVCVERHCESPNFALVYVIYIQVRRHIDTVTLNLQLFKLTHSYNFARVLSLVIFTCFTHASITVLPHAHLLSLST